MRYWGARRRTAITGAGPWTPRTPRRGPEHGHLSDQVIARATGAARSTVLG